VRASAADALGARLAPANIAALAKASSDDFRLVRIRAANSLGAVPESSVPEKLRPQVAKATTELMESMTARPDDWSSHYNRGNFEMTRGQTAQAAAEFDTASRLQPTVLPPWVNAALAQNLLGHNDRAEASLRKALSLEPTNGAVHLNLGMLLAEMDKLTEAETAFRAAFKYDPHSAQAAYNLGVMLAKSHPAEALEWCRKAATLRPEEAKYSYTLAFYQEQQGQAADAAQTLEKLLAQEPSDPQPYALLAHIYEQQNKPEKVLSVYRRAAANAHLPEEARAQFEAALRQ
jgi:Tfp pilus assembly protein PilF